MLYCRKAKCKSGNIKYRVKLVLKDVAKRDFEIILKHISKGYRFDKMMSAGLHSYPFLFWNLFVRRQKQPKGYSFLNYSSRYVFVRFKEAALWDYHSVH